MSPKDLNFLNEKDFEDEKKSSKFLSVLEIVIVVFLALIIVFMVGVFLLFSKEGATPEIFGYKIFLSKASTIRDIGENSAVFARADHIDDLKSGNVVLCSIGEEHITTMLRIQEVIEENGKKFYILRPDTNPENATIKLSQDDIIAKAEKQDQLLGNILAFARSKMGILTIVIVPFLIFFVLQIVHIVRLGKINKLYDDEDEDDLSEEDEILFSTLKDKENEPATLPQRKKPVSLNDHLPEVDEVENSVPAGEAKLKFDESFFAPKNNIHVDADGKAELPEKPKPTATMEDLINSVPKEAYKPREVVKSMTKDLNKQGYYTPKEVLPPPVIDEPVQVPELNDITVPDKAVQPAETIAPPKPKSRNNKTLDELMILLDTKNK